MIDRLLMPLLLIAAFVWALVSFSAAGPLLTHRPAATAATQAPVDLGRVVIVGKREVAPATLARNDETLLASRATQ